MAEEREDIRAGAPARRGSGKVTVGHGRSRRGDAKRGGAKRARADADEKRRRRHGSDDPVGARTSASAARQRQPGDTLRETGSSDEVMRPSGASGGQAPAPTGQTGRMPRSGGRAEKTPRSGGQAGQAPELAGQADGAEAVAGTQLREGGTSARIRDRARLSEKMSSSTRARLWLQSSALDFALVLVVATALTFTVSYGWYSAEDYRGNFLLIAALNVPLLLALFAGTWSKKAVVPSALATAAISVAYVVASLALSPDGQMFVTGPDGAPQVNDVAGNYGIFAIVLPVVAAVTFLLSRRTPGLVMLLIAASVACGAVQFMWREWSSDLPGIPSFVAMFTGLGMLFVYHCYKQSVYSANRVKKTTFVGAFAFSAAISAICVLVGVGVFYGVAQFAGYETLEVKPFQVNVSPPVDEKARSYVKTEVEGDETSDETDDQTDTTSDDSAGGDQTGIGGIGLLDNTFLASAAQALAGYDPNDEEQDYDDIAYLIYRWEMVLLTGLVLLAVLAAVLLQRARRKLRLKRIARQSPSYQAWYLYTFLLERFRRLKVRKPAHLTPLEFAVGFSKPMLPFTRGTDGVDFVEVSAIYQDVVFGGEKPSYEDLECMKAYYLAFFKNARAYTGWPRWVLWKFWRI